MTLAVATKNLGLEESDADWFGLSEELEYQFCPHCGAVLNAGGQCRHCDTLVVSSRERQDLLHDFRRLLSAWKEEILFVSSMTAIEESAHYLDIIALGQAAVPLLLRELERDPDYLFTALQKITGEDPVPPEDRGNLSRMTEHWITWGRRVGRLS
jgi:hypothetical protein